MNSVHSVVRAIRMIPVKSTHMCPETVLLTHGKHALRRRFSLIEGTVTGFFLSILICLKWICHPQTGQ